MSIIRDLTIDARDLTKVYGNPTPLVVKLTDNGYGIYNKKITITINGVSYERTTDNKGKASLNINLLEGSYPATITFGGDASYNAASKMIVVRILNNTFPQDIKIKDDEYFEINKIPLKVVLSDGFNTTMGTDVKETELLFDNRTLNAPTFFFNKGDHGVEFEISVVIKEEYYYEGYPVANALNQWNKWLTPVSVVTNAMDVPNNKYIMTIKSKKQNTHSYSIWKLRFKEYYENNFTFEHTYSDKTTSLSSIDRLLTQQQIIKEGSPTIVIKALQIKLQQLGYWDSLQYGTDEPRVPTGKWDSSMVWDIWKFQKSQGYNDGNGICDRDTIDALIGKNYNYSSLIDTGEPT